MFKPEWMNSQTDEDKLSYNESEFLRKGGFLGWDITMDHTGAAMVIRLLHLVMPDPVAGLVMD
ncbi:hypothetical protein ACQKKK_02215 [Peribacillus sp. NPDC006672]|uniref:hypothetical protein n=1 Tax=Peribacillus sp. NPDC006672 TaxID=3390606 RepID=UPI003D056210